MKREIKFRVFFQDKWKYFALGQTWTPLAQATYQECTVLGIPFYEYTGLKDKNGVDIYEGDIIAYRYSGGQMSGEICNKLEVKFGVFNIGANGFEYDFLINGHYVEDEYMYGLMIEGNTEVIGNIYENKELLTDKQTLTE